MQRKFSVNVKSVINQNFVFVIKCKYTNVSDINAITST